MRWWGIGGWRDSEVCEARERNAAKREWNGPEGQAGRLDGWVSMNWWRILTFEDVVVLLSDRMN